MDEVRNIRLAETLHTFFERGTAGIVLAAILADSKEARGPGVTVAAGSAAAIIATLLAATVWHAKAGSLELADMVHGALATGLPAAIVATLFSIAGADNTDVGIIENRVTVLVDFIASGFGGGFGSIADGETGIGTGAPASATPPGVVLEAGGAQGLCHRMLGALANPGSGNTLSYCVALGGLAGGTFECAGSEAVVIALARAAAEGPLAIGRNQAAGTG